MLSSTSKKLTSVIGMFEQEEDEQQSKIRTSRNVLTGKKTENRQPNNSAPNPIKSEITIIPVLILILKKMHTSKLNNNKLPQIDTPLQTRPPYKYRVVEQTLQLFSVNSLPRSNAYPTDPQLNCKMVQQLTSIELFEILSFSASATTMPPIPFAYFT